MEQIAAILILLLVAVSCWVLAEIELLMVRRKLAEMERAAENAARDPFGLDNLLYSDAFRVGGIDRSPNPYWRNKYGYPVVSETDQADLFEREDGK